MKERKKTFDACHCSYHNAIGPRNEIVSIGGYKNAFKKDNSNCLGILLYISLELRVRQAHIRGLAQKSTQHTSTWYN